ncbi:hypothetical protein PN459_21550 [Microcystis aeruginosa CS-567/02-A1]|uniref:hypothetical protein n=1 Tax=Microcystis aeruginosa TaxID=1126 RepID=UPI00232DE028|nr:hypothetical protein [Microcystis aeruginosa]MDB9402541.1 hypothetical protein [Microcystis aeruginosa CS-567/02-A1]
MPTRSSRAAKEVETLINGSTSATATNNNYVPSVASTGIATKPQANIKQLTSLDTDNLSVPQFDPSKFDVSDPLNPSESMPRATDKQLTQGTRIYAEATNALKLYQQALDLSREKFTTIGKHSRALGSGMSAALETEKVRGQILDYLSQKESTNQKGLSLGTAIATTGTNQKLAEFDQSNLQQKLEQASVKAENERLKTIQEQSKLQEFKLLLGEYI